jgi:hypothetical protein
MSLPCQLQTPPAFIFGEAASHNTAVMQLASFDNWDRRQDFKLSEFLALGFYHVGTGIRCSGCGRIQTEWLPNQNVLIQHARFNIRCPLIQDFYHNPIINYYFCSDQILQEIHTIIVNDNIAQINF